MSPIPNSTGGKFTVAREVTMHKKGPLFTLAHLPHTTKTLHKSPLVPPDVCCCQISCLDNAFHHHCLDRNMICETAVSHHLT